MAPLTIQIKKNSDGTSSLSCVRADGSVTWQRHPKPAHARFFLFHDLTHYYRQHIVDLLERWSPSRQAKP